MDVRLRRYYSKKIHGGRTLLARAVDFVMLRAFVFMLVSVIILYMSFSLAVSVIMSFFITAAISIVIFIYNRKRDEKLIKKDMLRIKEKCILQKLTFMPQKEYSVFINNILDGALKNVKQEKDGFYAQCEAYKLYAFQNHPSCELCANDVLKILRKINCDKIMLFALSDFSEDAKKMCGSRSGDINLIDGKKVLRLAENRGLMPDEKEAEQNAEEEMKASILTFENLRKNALGKAKIRNYIFCGIVITCWPFVAGFQFYYPLIAAACFILALLAYRKTRRQHDGIS